MTRFNTQIREVINRNILVSLAVEQGFNAYLPVYDRGVDFILHREKDGAQHLVQLKGRWIIDKKYIGRGISVAFPAGGEWYLIPHNVMVEQAERAGFTNTSSWQVGGAYSCPSLSKTLAEECAPFKLASIIQVAREAAD